jgi:hypothetical protein
MSKTWLRVLLLLSLLPAVLVALGSCSRDDSKEQAKGNAGNRVARETDDAETLWWCKEHEMPEGICAQCSAKLAADFKKKGDWCKEHNRPESQCFICHPELKEKFAAQYRARYGKEPPAMEEKR